jgi:hypothetical protein
LVNTKCFQTITFIILNLSTFFNTLHRTKMINQKKCEHCNNWTDGDKAFCSSCGGILDFRYRKERDDFEKELGNVPMLFDYVKLKNPNKNKFLFILEKVIHGGQAIIFGIISLVTFILLALPL